MALYKTIGMAALASAVVAMSGCAEAPIPGASNYYPQPQQYKVRAAGHWDLMANDVAAETLATLERNGLSPKTPMHVALPQHPSAFDAAFRELLVTKLVQRGASVYDKGGQQLELNYDAQVVHHNVLHHGDAQIGGGRSSGFGEALGSDYSASTAAGGPAYTEVLLTSGVTRQGQYVARKSNIYYVDNAVAGQFARLVPPRAVSMKVVNQ
ncbi:hypothetical protein [Comamonas humi]